MIFKTTLLFLGLMTCSLLRGSPGDAQDTTRQVPTGPFPVTPRIFHYPAKVVFNNRPYDIDLFVDFPEDSLKTVSLFLKTNRMRVYREIPLPMQRARYRYRYNPYDLPGDTLTYFFIVELTDYSLFASPLDDHGWIEPVVRPLVDPVAYYKGFK